MPPKKRLPKNTKRVQFYTDEKTWERFENRFLDLKKIDSKITKNEYLAFILDNLEKSEKNTEFDHQK